MLNRLVVCYVDQEVVITTRMLKVMNLKTNRVMIACFGPTRRSCLLLLLRVSKQVAMELLARNCE